MMIMILIIAKVMIMKSVMMKMIMMFTMMITIWLNTECSNYSTYICGGFLDFHHHFVLFFEIYTLTVQEIYFEKKTKLTAILRQVFCLSDVDCGIRANIVQFFEVVYNLFFFVIAGNFYGQSKWSILCSKYLIGKGKFLLLCTFSGKLSDLCQAKLMLWRFSNPSWLDIWTFWLLVSLCSMPRGL